MEATIADIREYLYGLGGEGEKVLSEREIAEQFSITRNHARELLLELVGEGVVERHPRSGYRYVSYHQTKPATAMLLRFVIEQEAAAAAMRNANREDEVRLILASEALKKAADKKDLMTFAAADREFHSVLVRASHDKMLIRFFALLQSTLFRLEWMRPVFSELHEKTQLAHEGILQAFLERNGQEMLERLKQHLSYAVLKKHLCELSAPVPRKYGYLGEPAVHPELDC